MPLTPEDLAAVGELVTTQLAAQLTAHNEAHPAMGPDAVKSILAEQITGLDLGKQIADAMAGLKAEMKPAEKAPTGKQDPEVLRAKAELEAKIQALTARTDAAERQREQAVANERRTSITTSLTTALSAANIDGKHHATLLPYFQSLRSSNSPDKPTIGYDDKGKLVFLESGAGYDVPVSVGAGIEKWAKSEGAKVYLPPVGHRGAGTGGGSGRGGRGGGQMTTTTELLGQLPIR